MNERDFPPNIQEGSPGTHEAIDEGDWRANAYSQLIDGLTDSEIDQVWDERKRLLRVRAERQEPAAPNFEPDDSNPDFVGIQKHNRHQWVPYRVPTREQWRRLAWLILPMPESDSALGEQLRFMLPPTSEFGAAARRVVDTLDSDQEYDPSIGGDMERWIAFLRSLMPVWEHIEPLRARRPMSWGAGDERDLAAVQNEPFGPKVLEEYEDEAKSIGAMHQAERRRRFRAEREYLWGPDPPEEPDGDDDGQ